MTTTSPVTVHGLRDVPLTTLHPHPDNPNRGDVPQLARSLEAFGQYRAIVAHVDGTILAGHHLWRAALSRGDETIRVEFIECDPDTARRILLADNRLAELGPGIDDEKLYALLADLPSSMFDGTGYTAKDLAELEKLYNPPQPHIDPDDVPGEDDTPTRCSTGDVWELGPHRLYVGSCGDTESVAAMLGGSTVDCIWTDPPYGVSYVGKTAKGLKIDNDKGGDVARILGEAFGTALVVAKPGAPIYVAHAPTYTVELATAMRDMDIVPRQTLVWVKNTIVLGHSDYHWQHESILYGYLPGTGRMGRGGKHWYGKNNASTVFHVPKPSSSRDHPTMKPVELIAPMLSNSCPPGGLVLDLFAGSGSTMAAAFLTGQRAALVEMSPRYADVIVRRWELLSGEPARKQEES